MNILKMLPHHFIILALFLFLDAYCYSQKLFWHNIHGPTAWTSVQMPCTIALMNNVNCIHYDN